MEPNFHALFDELDSDHQGYLPKQRVFDLLNELGYTYDSDEIVHGKKGVAIDSNDQTIELDQFIAIFERLKRMHLESKELGDSNDDHFSINNIAINNGKHALDLSNEGLKDADTPTKSIGNSENDHVSFDSSSCLKWDESIEMHHQAESGDAHLKSMKNAPQNPLIVSNESFVMHGNHANVQRIFIEGQPDEPVNDEEFCALLSHYLERQITADDLNAVHSALNEHGSGIQISVGLLNQVIAAIVAIRQHSESSSERNGVVQDIQPALVLKMVLSMMSVTLSGNLVTSDENIKVRVPHPPDSFEQLLHKNHLLSFEYKKAHDRILALEKLNDQLDHEKLILNGRIEEHVHNEQELKYENIRLQQSLQPLQQQLQHLKVEHDSISQALRSKEKENAERAIELEHERMLNKRSNEQEQALLAEINSLHDQIDALRRQVHSSQGLQANLSEQVKDASSKLDELEKLRMYTAELEQQLEEQQRYLAELERELKASKECSTNDLGLQPSISLRAENFSSGSAATQQYDKNIAGSVADVIAPEPISPKSYETISTKEQKHEHPQSSSVTLVRDLEDIFNDTINDKQNSTIVNEINYLINSLHQQISACDFLFPSHDKIL